MASRYLYLFFILFYFLHLAFTNASAATSSSDSTKNPEKYGKNDDTNYQRLKSRIDELEAAKSNQEDAIRSIIREAMSSSGSNINDSVSLGGTIQVKMGKNKSFTGESESYAALNSIELDFEIQSSDWSNAGFVIEYDDGQNRKGSAQGVERFNLDTAYVSLGNSQRFPLKFIAGKVIIPFGLSTGNSLTDALSVDDPLTISAFEFRRTAVGLDISWPTQKHINSKPVSRPPINNKFFTPALKWFGRGLGYKAATVEPLLKTVSAPQALPPLNLSLYYYDSDSEGSSPDQFNVSLGYRNRSHCGVTYQELAGKNNSIFCPWSMDFKIDYNSSIYNSRFLSEEYGVYAKEIGKIPGMAGSVKASFSALSIITEWNASMKEASFTDASNNSILIRPATWQLSLAYQFDWNPWLESIGGQGTYLSLSYSQSRGFAGANSLIDATIKRTGNLAKRKVLLSLGEWILEELNFTLEYSYAFDYPVNEGGTGKVEQGIYSVISYAW